MPRADYRDNAFGSWSIDFSSDEIPKHRLVWDGRDRWLVLQTERPEGKRPTRFSAAALEQMTWEDRLTAESQREWDAWEDKWIDREESEQTRARALQELPGT